MRNQYAILCGPFADTRKNADDFCHNLYLSYATTQAALKLAEVEKEYNEAVLNRDDELAAKKRIELQTYQSSLTLTAHMFDEVDEIST